jgi:hypothetical protein
MTWRKGLSFDPTTRRKVWIDIVQATMETVAEFAELFGAQRNSFLTNRHLVA